MLPALLKAGYLKVERGVERAIVASSVQLWWKTTSEDDYALSLMCTYGNTVIVKIEHQFYS